VACVLTVALILALESAGAQEAPTCDESGTCLIPPVSIVRCDQHAGTGECPLPPVPYTPSYAG